MSLCQETPLLLNSRVYTESAEVELQTTFTILENEQRVSSRHTCFIGPSVPGDALSTQMGKFGFISGSSMRVFLNKDVSL